MYAWRYLDDNYTEDPDFVLTDQSTVKPVFLSQGTALAQDRPENTQLGLLADYSFKVVIAGSFGGIHYNSELNNGMLPIVQPREVREKLAQLKPTDQVTVDLEQQKSSHQLENSLSKLIANGNTSS